MVDEALKFIAGAGDKPFAVFVTFHAPHEQIATPEKFRTLYADIDDPTKRDYYGSVSLVDREVGRLLAWLDDHRLRERTLVLFTSDNGPEGLRRYPKAIHSHGSAGPLRGGKLSMYEGGIRVPGILRWPGRAKAGTRCDEPVCFTDLLPTLCAAAGTEPPKGRTLDGTNVLPLLEGKPVTRARPLYWQYDKAEGGPWTLALRQGPWKLLADPKRERFALYNVVEDAAETRDRAAEQPEQVRKLRAALDRLYREINP